MIARVEALLWSLVLWLTIGLDAASACTCERPPANVTSYEQQKAWEFGRADTVVRGKIISVKAGEGVVRDGLGVVLFTMRVHSVLKGQVPKGEVKIITKAGSASCGMGERLLAAAEEANDMSLELFPGQLPGEFQASWCGYFRFGVDPNQR